jgi:hypothetical protein
VMADVLFQFMLFSHDTCIESKHTCAYRVSCKQNNQLIE